MKVLIVDDEKIVRKGIVSILQQAFPDMQTIAEASNGEEAMKTVKASIPHRLAQVYENLTRCALLFSVPHQCMRAACPLPSQTALPEIQT